MEVQTASKKDYEQIEKDYAQVLSEYGIGEGTISIQIDRANFS